MGIKSYVGITGAVTTREVTEIVKEFSEHGYTLDSIPIPMLGFLVSYKTLNGQPTTNRRYPKIETLPGLLEQTDNQVFTMIHYNSREMDSLSDQVTKIFDRIYDKSLCRAIQLNIVWPEIGQVKKIKDKFPEMRIVLQASHKVMENKTAKKIVNEITNYGDSLDYVLIDPSGGRGLRFDLESSLALYKELKAKLPKLTIGFAGGFTGGNVGRIVKQLINKIGRTDFCIDAEGGLRDKISSEYGDDLLNMVKVRHYLWKASQVLKRNDLWG